MSAPIAKRIKTVVGRAAGEAGTLGWDFRSKMVTGSNAGKDMGGRLSITLDDGYRDNFEVAAPILQFGLDILLRRV